MLGTAIQRSHSYLMVVVGATKVAGSQQVSPVGLQERFDSTPTMKGITMNANTIAADIAFADDEVAAILAYAEVTYAKVIKAGKGAYRVETKESEDLDSWPTLVGVYTSKAEALTVVANAGYTLVPSWQVAMKLEDYEPKTALV
jgi:hypothetical protein